MEESHDRSPICRADDVSAVQRGGDRGENCEVDEILGEPCEVWALGVGECLAALDGPRVALAGWRRRRTLRTAAVAAAGHWGDGGGDAARRSESNNQRDERLVE